MKIKEVIDEILETVTPLKRKGTQAMHFIYLKEIRHAIGNRALSAFNRKDFMQWIGKLKLTKKRKTFDDYSKFINIIFNYAYQQRMCRFLTKFPKVDTAIKKTGRVYTNEELNLLWKHMNGPMKLQFILALEMFMRLREALYLKWDRVDLQRRVINLRAEDVKTGSKTGKGRCIPISENAYNILIELKASGAHPVWVFPNPSGGGPINNNRRAWRTAKKRSQVTGRARWHDLRHTALTLAIGEHKVPAAHLCLVAGLSIRTLERVYLHPQVDHLRSVTEQINVLKIA